MDQITIRFEREKETPGTVRFKEIHADDTDPVVATLYVKKPAWARLGKPEALEVTIGAAQG